MPKKRNLRRSGTGTNKISLISRVDPDVARAFWRICEANDRSVDGQLRWMIKRLIEQQEAQGDNHD